MTPTVPGVSVLVVEPVTPTTVVVVPAPPTTVVVVPPGPVVVLVPPPMVELVVGASVVVVRAHADVVTTLVSSVTAPLRASSRPSMMALVLAVIEVSARIVPTKVEPTPRVAELPTCQNTLQGRAPLIITIRLSTDVMRVEPAWKTQTAFGSPCASSVSVPALENSVGDL